MTTKPKTQRRHKKRDRDTSPGRGLSGTEDLDAIILAYVQPRTLGTLMRKCPNHSLNHPLLAPNSRMWYNRIAMTISNDWAPTPPYQVDREGLVPTDYRSLWYALNAASYLNFMTMTRLMANTASEPPTRQYVGTPSLGKNALEAALDMTAIHTGDEKAPYRWSEAIIALLVEYIVQYVYECEETEDTIALSGGGRLPNWIMVSIASRGCTRLIDSLVLRLGESSGNLATISLTVGRWIFDALGYAPERYVLPTEDNALPTTRYPTLTAEMAVLLWDTYINVAPDVVSDAIDMAMDDGSLDGMLYRGIARGMDNIPNACRDRRLFDTIFTVVDSIGIMDNDEDMVEVVMWGVLMSPYREADDYSVIHTMMGRGIKYLTSQLDGGDQRIRDNISNRIAERIPIYYATRIATKEQSRRFFRDSGFTADGSDTIKKCHSIFTGNVKRVHKTIATATQHRDDAELDTAILYVRIYIAGRIDHDRREPTTGTMRAIDLLESDEVESLMDLVDSSYRRGTVYPYLHPLSILATAARDMEVLKVAYSLFGLEADARVMKTDKEAYRRTISTLSQVTDVLIEVARDPYSNEEALNWLIDQFASVIPSDTEGWRNLLVGNPNVLVRDLYVPFPREELWTTLISQAIQATNSARIPYTESRYDRLRSLIHFSSVPSNSVSTTLAFMTLDIRNQMRPPLPSMDLRREQDGGLPVDVVIAVARVLGQSQISSPSMISLTYHPFEYAWDPIALQNMKGAISSVQHGLRTRWDEQPEADGKGSE